MQWKKTTVLVTGGTGFVGSHLVEALLKKGSKVITTFQTQDPLSYFYSQKLHEKAVMTHVDVNNFEEVFHMITKFHVDYIFHLAAQALVDVAYDNPVYTLRTNIIGTVNVLESARLYPHIQGVIVASSDKAYGKLTKGKYVETDALRGDHPYEVSKSAADLICYSYFKTYGVPVVTTRFGNIYGEGDLNFSRIIPGIMKAIIADEMLEIRSNGKYIRDYLYVKDVVEGYLLLAEKIKRVKGEAFNFGSKETISVLDVIRLVEKVLKKKIKYKILNNAKNEIPYQSLSFEKIKKLGWNAQFSLSSYMKDIFDWYKKVL